MKFSGEPWGYHCKLTLHFNVCLPSHLNYIVICWIRRIILKIYDKKYPLEIIMYLALIISINPPNKNGAYGFCCFKCKETKAFMLFYTHTHTPTNHAMSTQATWILILSSLNKTFCLLADLLLTCFCFRFLFERRAFCVIQAIVTHYVNQASIQFTRIFLPLSAECQY